MILTHTLILILERGQGMDRPAVGLRHTIWIHTICVVCGSHHAASYCLGHCNLSIEEDDLFDYLFKKYQSKYLQASLIYRAFLSLLVKSWNS